MDYFAKHAKDPMVAAECQMPSEAFIQLIEIITAFSVTGRINEKAFYEMDRNVFENTKIAAGNHFRDWCEENHLVWELFVKDLGLTKWDAAKHANVEMGAAELKESVANLITILFCFDIVVDKNKYISMLGFEKTAWLVVSMAHDFETMRVYEPKKYEDVIKKYDKFINNQKSYKLHLAKQTQAPTLADLAKQKSDIKVPTLFKIVSRNKNISNRFYIYGSNADGDLQLLEITKSNNAYALCEAINFSKSFIIVSTKKNQQLYLAIQENQWHHVVSQVNDLNKLKEMTYHNIKLTGDRSYCGIDPNTHEITKSGVLDRNLSIFFLFSSSPNHCTKERSKLSQDTLPISPEESFVRQFRIC